jgi:hypothetical protein
MTTDLPTINLTTAKARVSVRQDPESMILAIWLYCGFQPGEDGPDAAAMAAAVLAYVEILQETLANPPPTGRLPGESPRRKAASAAAALWHFCDLDFANSCIPTAGEAAAEIAAYIRHLRGLLPPPASPAERHA